MKNKIPPILQSALCYTLSPESRLNEPQPCGRAAAWTTVFIVFSHLLGSRGTFTLLLFASPAWNFCPFSRGPKIVVPSIEGGRNRVRETMIPPKLLVYRREHSDANLETLPETWRRKKSCSDLFQNGYRVRQGHHRQEDRDKQTGTCRSVLSALRVLSNWGKSVIVNVPIVACW